MNLISWNVNGIRACIKKGFTDFFKKIDADIFCIQETKMQVDETNEEVKNILNLPIFENYYSYWNTKVHGLTRQDTEEAPVFPEVWKQIEPMIEGLPLVAHNKSFDESCLKAVFRCYQMDYPDYKFYCTCVASRRAFPQLPNHQLHTVSEYCGYHLENHHHALADAEACAWIAREIL